MLTLVLSVIPAKLAFTPALGESVELTADCLIRLLTLTNSIRVGDEP